LQNKNNLHWYCTGCNNSAAKVRMDAVEVQLKMKRWNRVRMQELEVKLDHTEIAAEV